MAVKMVMNMVVREVVHCCTVISVIMPPLWMKKGA